MSKKRKHQPQVVAEKKEYKIGNPCKNKNLVLWTTKEFNITEPCAVCGGQALYKQDGYNTTTGQCYVLHCCTVLECNVEVEMRIFMEIR